MSTKTNKGDALLYTSNELNYKVINNLQKHKDKKIESIFIEVLSKSQKNVIFGCIYKHRNLVVTKFNECYLQPLLDNKDVTLMGDFNVDLLHCETYNQSKDFLDKMLSSK